MDNSPNTLFVGSLAKGLKILRAFDMNETEMSLSELVRKTGLDKSSVQRLANTLYLEGFLYKDGVTRRFKPSLAWLEMANAYYWSDPLVALAMPKLIDLSRDIGETVNLARLSDGHIIYVFRLPNTRSRFAATIAGSKLPALGTASGRAILSTWDPASRANALRDWPTYAATPATILDRDQIAREVEDAVRNGYSITHGQALVNEISIAAPIRDASGRATAAVQCSVSGLQWDHDRITANIVPALTNTANSILIPSRAGYPNADMNDQ
ncbi:IclR family transcriptional regulator [Rhodobacteraceae bacterium KMM 6894]|nr:IclR family transcriptional regulator [Rhodobacteraceae bacterium KMM 6894]